MLVSEEQKRQYSQLHDQQLHNPKFQMHGYESDSESVKQYRANEIEKNRQFAEASQSCCGRFKEIFKIAIPISFSLILQLAIDFGNIYFSGHFKDSKYLAANGLGLSILNIFGFATMYGWAGALETLGSHAFGSGNFMLNGHYFNQARLTVLIASLVFIVPLFVFSGTILQLVGVNEEIAALTGRYLLILLPGVLLQIQSTVVRKFFRTQRVGWVNFAVVTFAAPMHIGGLYFWINYMGYGFDAIPAWTVATYTFSVCGMYFYLYCCEIVQKESLIRFSCQTFRDMSQFIGVAFQSMLLTCLEWWSFEITVIALSFLGQSYLSAHVIMLNIGGVLYLFSSFSFSVTATSLVGNTLGLGPSKLCVAKKYAFETVVYGMLINIGLVTLLYFYYDIIVPLLTVNEGVVELVEGVIYFLIIEDMLEVLGGILNGILRGLGKMKIPVFITTVGFFVIYQPVSLYFAFHGYYLRAIWGGLIVVVSLIVICYLLLIFCYNWKKISESYRELSENYFNDEVKEPFLLNDSK